MKMVGYVYLVLNADRNAAKVGFTTNPYARLAQMQSANDRPLAMEFAIPAMKEVEAELHQRFASSRIRLAWFSDVEAVEEVFASLEQEHADRQLAKEFYGSTVRVELDAADVRALLGVTQA